MGVALVTSNEAVVTALVDVHWRAAGEGWPGVKHNWALPPLGRDNKRGKKGGEECERERERLQRQPTPQRGLNFWRDIWWDRGPWDKKKKKNKGAVKQKANGLAVYSVFFIIYFFISMWGSSTNQINGNQVQMRLGEIRQMRWGWNECGLITFRGKRKKKNQNPPASVM